MFIRLRNMYAEDEVGELYFERPTTRPEFDALCEQNISGEPGWSKYWAGILTELRVPRPPASWTADADLSDRENAESEARRMAGA